MILLIIFGTLLVLGIVLGIVWSILYDRYDFDKLLHASIGIGILGGVFFTVLGLISIFTNCQPSADKKRIELTEKINSLNSTREVLINCENSDIIRLEITSYNNSVSELKSDISQGKITLSNPWINTFTCYVYNEFDPDMVTYL